MTARARHAPAAPPRDLREARARLWREACDLDEPMTALAGALDAAYGLALALVEKRDEAEERGLRYLADRALEHLTELRERLDRLGDLAKVVNENDDRALAAAAEGEADHG